MHWIKMYTIFFNSIFCINIIITSGIQKKKFSIVFELGLTKNFAPHYALWKHLFYSFHRHSIWNGQRVPSQYLETCVATSENVSLPQDWLNCVISLFFGKLILKIQKNFMDFAPPSEFIFIYLPVSTFRFVLPLLIKICIA